MTQFACSFFVLIVREGQNPSRSRHLRQCASLPEQKAWSVLRQFRRYGVPIRRQHPVAGFTVDFAAVSRRLVIEIDGPLHLLEGQKLKDAERDERLRQAGWRVLRIPADQAEDGEGLFARFADEFGL